MLNVDKGVAHVDNRCKKLEKLFVQQIQDVKLRLASLLNRIRRAKSASEYQNAELKRLAFLRPTSQMRCSATRGPCLFSETRDPHLYDRMRDS